jgi:large subunit ribosomal protein L21e
MPAGHGQRSRTRDLFARPFRRKGYIPLTTYLRTYRIGDHVDIKVNGAVHKGMPHKFYHGRTGIVWNVTKRAIGVEMNKQVRSNAQKKKEGVFFRARGWGGGDQEADLCFHTLLSVSLSLKTTSLCGCISVVCFLFRLPFFVYGRL